MRAPGASGSGWIAVQADGSAGWAGHQALERPPAAQEQGAPLLETVGVALAYKPLLDQWIAAMPLSPAPRAGRRLSVIANALLGGRSFDRCWIAARCAGNRRNQRPAGPSPAGAPRDAAALHEPSVLPAAATSSTRPALITQRSGGAAAMPSRSSVAWLCVGLTCGCLAAALTFGASPLHDYIERRVWEAVQEQVVWSPDSPEQVQGECARWLALGRTTRRYRARRPRCQPLQLLAPAPARPPAASAPAGLAVTRLPLPTLQHALPTTPTPPCRRCALASTSSTSPTWRRCGRAPSPSW